MACFGLLGDRPWREGGGAGKPSLLAAAHSLTGSWKTRAGNVLGAQPGAGQTREQSSVCTSKGLPVRRGTCTQSLIHPIFIERVLCAGTWTYTLLNKTLSVLSLGVCVQCV